MRLPHGTECKGGGGGGGVSGVTIDAATERRRRERRDMNSDESVTGITLSMSLLCTQRIREEEEEGVVDRSWIYVVFLEIPHSGSDCNKTFPRNQYCSFESFHRRRKKKQSI